MYKIKMKPNALHHNPDPAYLRDLITQSGLSQRQAAKTIGVGERAMRSYLSDRGSSTAQDAPYPVQYALECLACSREIASCSREIAPCSA